MSLKKHLKALYAQRKINQERDREGLLITNCFPSDFSCPLTDKEKLMVVKRWGVKPRSFKELEMYKSIHGFDERFLSHDMYLPIISRKLNDYHYTEFFEDKGLLGKLTNTSLKFPKCYIRCIGGEFYDENFHQITRNDAVHICATKNKLLFKISKGSSGGKSIEILELAHLDNENKVIKVEKLLENTSKYFVIQECIEQHPSMSRFNSSSVNTLRLFTLYLNGKVTLCGSQLRIGREGSVVDNLGAGGMSVGIKENGILNERGYGLNCIATPIFNGVTFKNQKIEQFPFVASVIMKEHVESFPLCKFIGWDVCIDKENDPVVIELNSSQPGISGMQVNMGPIFGDRTDEVIEYCKNKEFKYNRSIFSY